MPSDRDNTPCPSLLGCPFCGGLAIPYNDHPGHWCIVTKCEVGCAHVGSSRGYPTKAEAIAAWNTRAPSQFEVDARRAVPHLLATLLPIIADAVVVGETYRWEQVLSVAEKAAAMDVDLRAALAKAENEIAEEKAGRQADRDAIEERFCETCNRLMRTPLICDGCVIDKANAAKLVKAKEALGKIVTLEPITAQSMGRARGIALAALREAGL